MKIKAIRKDKTAVKLEDGNWYKVRDYVQKYLEHGKEAIIEDGEVVKVIEPEVKPADTIKPKDREERVTKLALLNTATKIVELALHTINIQQATELQTFTVESITNTVIEVAKTLEYEYVNK